MSHPSHSRQPGRSHLPWVMSSALLLTVLLRLSPAQVQTSITPDGSLGTTVTQQGNVHSILGGRRPNNGPNLFHSFERFSVGTREVADFRAPTGITNILSRVTGGQQSSIDGTLRSTTDGTTRSAANLYLLNPSGVLFGPNARLEVGGAFHVSTADYLRLADGSRFFARLSDTSTFSVSPPEAFGFLRDSPAGIELQGSQLQVPEGATLAIVGGNIQISGGRSAPDPSAPPTLGAPQGRVTVVSVAAQGEVNPHGDGQEVSAFPSLGTIAILEGARLDTSGESGGIITLRGGSLLVDTATLASDTLGKNHGAPTGIDIQVTGDVVVRNAGDLTSGTGGIATNAGPDASRVSTGNAGDINIVAGRVHLQTSMVQSSASQTGNAGSITVQAKEVTLSDGARLDNGTLGPGAGGAMTIITEMLTIQGTTPDGQTASGIGVVTVGDVGPAGLLVIQARDIVLSNGGQIGGGTGGPGPGGTVRVTATQTLTAQGVGPDPSVPSGVFGNAECRASGVCGAESNGVVAGAGGTVIVQARDIVLSDGAQIASATFGRGPGGNVRVTATETLTLRGTNPGAPDPTGRLRRPSGVYANTQWGNEGAGAAGTVVVQARDVALSDGARISSSTLGPGAGGTVHITATESLTLTGRQTSLRTSTEGGGRGGNLVVRAPTIRLADGAAISAQSTDIGAAGTIQLAAADALLLRGGSAVTTEARFAPGGGIEVAARTIVRLQDSMITTSVHGGDSHAGTITIDPQAVVLQNGQIRANAVGGPGGNITIRAEVLLQDAASAVTASSERSIAGTIEIHAPIANLSGIVAPLPQTMAAAEGLLRNRCLARLREGTVSTLVVRGREGVPTPPDGVLPGQLTTPPTLAAAALSPRDLLGSPQGQPMQPTNRRRQGTPPGWTLPPHVLALECGS